MAPCLETLSHCICLFVREHFSFLETRIIYIERLLSRKRWANFKSDSKWFAGIVQFMIQRNQAISYLLIFPFCRIHANTSSVLFKLFEDQVCLSFDSIVFLTHVERKFHFSSLTNETHEVAKILCQVLVRGYQQFLSLLLRTVFSLKVRKFNPRGYLLKACLQKSVFTELGNNC